MTHRGSHRTPRLSPIGLDIGAAEIRAVQLCRQTAGNAVVCSAVFPRQTEPGPSRPLEPREAAWIAGVLHRRGFVGNRVSVFAPHGSCSSQIVDLPDRDSGAPADIIVYDIDGLAIDPPWIGEIEHDLPGGEWRRVQRAKGYDKIIVNGQVTFDGGECTGATPGSLLRHGRG